MKAHLARGCHNALGDHIAAHDATENVDEDAFDVRVREDDLEGRGHPLLGGAATHVEEVGRIAAIELDDVHGRHGQAGAVDHAADVTVELDIVQLVAPGFELHRIFLVFVAQLDDVRMAEQRAVVEAHLGVERDHPAATGDNQRIDLQQGDVELGEGLIHGHHEPGRRLDLAPLETEREGDLAGLEGHQTDGRIDRLLDDLLRMLGRNLFDLHPALGGSDDRYPAGSAIDEHREVELPRNVTALFNIEALDLLAALAGLFGDEDLPEHRLGVVPDFLDR